MEKETFVYCMKPNLLLDTKASGVSRRARAHRMRQFTSRPLSEIDGATDTMLNECLWYSCYFWIYGEDFCGCFLYVRRL